MALTLRVVVLSALLGSACAQMAGTSQEEEHPSITFSSCSKAGGCVADPTTLTMDSQWRWLHNAQSSNCIQNNKWTVDEGTCGSTCAMEGISKADYLKTYGVSEVQGGVQLKYVNGPSIGSRLYMMEEEGTYKMFKLLNKEFTFEVDVSTLACGLNGAVYFVEMQENGGMGQGTNKAGAKYGTGYCDAQCPHDMKFIAGECNLKGWHMTPTGPVGHYGSCCSELDIWEANAFATAFTAHPCATVGPKRCEGDSEPNICGDTPENCDCCGTPESCPCCGRYKGVCDRDGCDYNSYRLGNKTFFGKGPQYTVDSSKPMTVVTQFITSDGTDSGDLVEIRRVYVQDGKIINNSLALGVGQGKVDSITDDYCSAQKKAFDNPDDFSKKGSLRAMGEAMRRGMVLVLSLWDDELTKMVWLDSAKAEGSQTLSTPGVQRGPCAANSGSPQELRASDPGATVKYTNIRVGDLGTTFGPSYKAAGAAPAAPVVPAAPAVLPAAPITPVAPVAPAIPAGGPVQSVMVNPGTVVQATLAPPGTVVSGMVPLTNGPVTGVVTPGVVPVPAVVPAAQPAAAVIPATSSSTPTCCSSAKGSDKCGTCWPHSAQTSGWCASADTCGKCGGQWCQNGVVFAQAYEVEDLLVARPVQSVGYAVCGLAAGLVVLGAVAAVGLRAYRRRSGPSQGELELLFKDESAEAAA